jgi:hypothetical protein
MNIPHTYGEINMMRIHALLAAVLAIALAIPFSAQAASKNKTITPPPFFMTLKRDKSVADSVKRGKKVFRSTGCVGCHPRGRTVGGTAVDVMGNRNPVPIPSLIGAAEHFPRMTAASQVVSVGQFNDLCSTVFIGNQPMDPYSTKYRDLEAYVVSLSPKVYKRMLTWEKKRKAFMKTVKTTAGAGNPCGGGNPCAAKNPCGGNPCASKNPCAGKNPCNPCAGKNPCARK